MIPAAARFVNVETAENGKFVTSTKNGTERADFV